MPYQAVNKEEEKAEKEAKEMLTDNKSTPEDHPKKGADLLLSLTKASRNPIVTPVEPAAMSGVCFPSRTSSMGPPVAGNHHRLLYHSPIKAHNSATTTHGCGSDSSSDLYSMGHAPAWSPTSFNGMVPVFHASFGRSPSCLGEQKRHMNFDEEKSSSSASKRSRPEAEEKKELEIPEKPKQRTISPSSSNEKLEGELESTSRTSNLARPWGPAGPPMYPHWQQQGFPSHMAYPPPPYMAYPPQFPHPWGMFGPAPHPSMYPPPPYPMQKQPPASPAKASLPTKAKQPEPQIDWKFAESSLNRCVPLKHPVMNRYWT